MPEKDKGKILRDKDISLPRIEDFYYNDLVGVNFTKMTQDNIFYMEDPPENEDWTGFTADQSLLSLKADKKAFKISEPYIATNNVTGCNVILDMARGNITWPDSADITETIETLKKRAAFDAYRVSQGASQDEKTWIKDAAELRLLFFNPPVLPSFTTTFLSFNKRTEANPLFSKKFSEVKNSNYIYCKKPYPYSVQIKTESTEEKASIDFSSPKYKEKDYGYKDDDLLWFTRDAGNTPRQVIPLQRIEEDDTITQKVLLLNQDNSNAITVADGYLARDIFVETIQKAQDIRLVLDTSTMSSQESSVYTQKYPLLYGENLGPLDQISNYVKSLKNSMWDDQWYATVGYNAYGLDRFKRVHGVVYVKVKNENKKENIAKQNQDYVWWNLNKYIIYRLAKNAESNSGHSVNERYYVDYGPTQLKPYTYDYINNHYVDAFWNNALDNDKKRLAVQKEIFKAHSDLLPNLDSDSFEKILYEWTVTLGDVTFFVPPESIRIISQTATSRVPLIRARGAVAKGAEKSQQFYEISVYFNEERGINGVEYIQHSPNYDKQQKTGKTFAYKMNGFRSLLAEMKFVPFVPIVNRTFNEVFGVYAVCFENLSVSTVPGFPKLLKVTIELSKFNYQVYMPDIPGQGYMFDGVYYNPFSCCIDYDTLRYYYQKPIILGDLLHMKLTDPTYPISVNSYEFYTKTIFSNRTALLPCDFNDPTIRVYIANEDHLQEMDKLKKTLLARTMDPDNRYIAEGSGTTANVSSNYTPTDMEIRMIKDASTFMDHVPLTSIYADTVGKITELADNLNKPGRYGQFQVLKDGISVKETVNGKETVVTYQCGSESDVRAFMRKYCYDPICERIKTAAKDLKNIQGEKLLNKVSVNDTAPQLNIEFNMGAYITSPKDFLNSQREASVYISKENAPTIEPKQIFADYCVHLNIPSGYIIGLDNDNLSTSILGAAIRAFKDTIRNGQIDPSIDANQSILFLSWCKTQALPIAQANERMSELKQSIDLETVHTLKYDLLIGTELNEDTTADADKNAIVTQFSATVGNTYARTSVSGADGSAPQYMGGQDIHISWTLETTSEEIAGKFKSLPELASYFNRTYRHVLSTYPIKIDSDFTRMLGVTEIMIDSVQVETTPSFPGLYKISVMGTSVDRTLRNKEALKALDVKNQTLSLSRLLQYRQSVDIKNYEKLDSELCKAEVYPDLELPTMSELGQLGFRYIRYKDKERNHDDFYVDPDFYFVYPAITYGRILLESLQYAFSANVPASDVSQFFVDTSNCVQEADTRTLLLKPGTENEQLKTQKEDIATVQRKKAEDDPLYHLGGDRSMIFRIPFGSWNLGTKMRCSYTEPYYINELEKAKTGNLESRYRIQIDGKTEAQIETEKNNVNEQFRWIELYSEKDKDIKGSSINPKYKDDENKIVDRFNTFEAAAKDIKTWLSTHNISAVLAAMPINSKIIKDADKYDTVNTVFEDVSSEKQCSDEMLKTVENFFVSNSDLIALLKKAYIFQSDMPATVSSMYSEIAKIIVSAADARSSKVEYNASSKDSGEWLARAQDAEKPFTAKEETELMLKDRFGIFGIKRYKEADFLKILPSTEIQDFKNTIGKYTDDERRIQESYYLLDPYYRFQPIQKRREYLKSCATNYNFAALAFTRIMLWYLATLIELHIYPSVEYDVKRKECLTISKAELKGKSAVDVVRQVSTKDINEAINGNSELNNTDQQSSGGQDASILMEGMINFVEANGTPLDLGKFFTATVLAMLGEPFRAGTVFSMVKEREYDNLNRLVASLVSVKYQKRNDADPTFQDRAPLMRKYLLALHGHEVVDSVANLGEARDVSPSSQYLTDYNTKMALLAASNPARYMRDSFYDAVRTDYRGRMLRAFPTFYMIFIDEGREIGLFKLHDNFYNINAISEIQVVKSRLLAADTCIITMSNMFQTFTTNDEDCTVNYKGGLGDLWESFWTPQASAQRAEQLRVLAADKINRAKLQPGIRIHVRLGYGANARDLPVVFNGTIAEIQGNELVKVVAQGDGIELCNPLYEQEDADVVKNNDVRMSVDSAVCGAPPKDILQAFLTAKGGCIAASLRGRYRGRKGTDYGKDVAKDLRKLNQDAAKKYNGTGIFNTTEMNMMVKETGDNLWGTINRVLLKYFPDNPYGIFHFGDPDYTAIFSQGEPAQNLYEITTNKEKIDSTEVEQTIKIDNYSKDANQIDQTAKKTDLTQDDFAYFGDAALDLNTEIDSWYSYWNQKDNLPYISFKPFGKTIWEIMHICQSIAPDWMTGVRDFSFRSTIFLGKPHYYYAYKYQKSETGVWIEKRKPYQQWHVYNSSYDIIRNSITASSDHIKTNAVGIYELEGIFGGSQKTEPLWVDQDIYPEYQRSSIVETNYFGKSYTTHGPFGRIVAGGSKVVGAVAGGIAGTAVAPGYGTVVGAGIGAAAGHGLGLLINDFASYITNNLLDKHAETKIDETGAVRSHEKAAAKMTINALKDSMRQMYQGAMVIIGDPSVNPQDRMILEDAYEDMEGMCEVREVVHQLSPDTGFTTTITPDLISAHEPRSEIAKQSGFAHFIATHGTALAITGMYLAFIMRKDALGQKELTWLQQAMEQAGATKFVSKTKGATKRALDVLWNRALQEPNLVKQKILFDKIGYKIRNMTILPDKTRKLLDYTKNLPLLKKVPWKTAKIFGGKALIIAELGLAGLNSFIYRTVRNSQTLTLFPMKKFGKVFAAGVDGYQGLLYGAVSYNNPGALESFFARFFSGDTAKDASDTEQAVSWVINLFLDEDIQNEAQKYQRNTEFVCNAIYDPYNVKETQLQSLTKSQLDKSLYKPKTAYALSLLPRAAYTKDEKSRTVIKNAVKNQTYVENIQDWITNPNLKNLYYLPLDISLERVFKTGFLRLIQDEIIKESKYGIDDPSLQNYSFIDLQGRALNIYALKREEIRSESKKEVTILDVPYLCQEGRTVLAELCDFILNTLMNKPDDNEIRQAAKDTALILSSALQVGSENSLYASGHHFILTGTGQLAKSGETSLRNFVSRYYDLVKNQLNDKKVDFPPCFKIDDAITSDKEVGITIYPLTPYGDTIKNKDDIPTKQTIENYNGKDISVEQSTTLFSDTEKADASAATGSKQKHDTFERYLPKDTLNRANGATVLLDWESVKNNIKQSHDTGNYLPTGYRADSQNVLSYERCNLVEGPLTSKASASENLITGTNQFHKEKKTYEQRILSLLNTDQKKYHGTVLYKVVPVYDNNNLLAKAVWIEAVAYPSEDERYTQTDIQLSKEAKLPFNVIIHNVQDGVQIQYADGSAKKQEK